MPVYDPFKQCFVSWFHSFFVVRKNAKMMMSIYEPIGVCCYKMLSSCEKRVI